MGSRSHMSQETLDFVEDLKQEGKEVSIVSKGSSLKFCLVAEGQADIYPRFAPTMEWDTAAGQAICNAVGIEVISKETNQSLKYNKENLLNDNRPHFAVPLPLESNNGSNYRIANREQFRQMKNNIRLEQKLQNGEEIDDDDINGIDNDANRNLRRRNNV